MIIGEICTFVMVGRTLGVTIIIGEICTFVIVGRTLGVTILMRFLRL